MGAKFFRQNLKRRKNSGQSLLEFAIIIPVILGFFFILIEVEQAISSAIVSQKYARAQLHFITFNHRFYPEEGLIDRDFGRFWVGVSAKSHYEETVPEPEAPTYKIGRAKAPREDETAQTEYDGEDSNVQKRQKVRIRVISAICLPPRYLNKTTGLTDQMQDGSFVAGAFPYCRN